MVQIVPLTQASALHEDASALVQRNTMTTSETGDAFLTKLKADKDIVAKVPAAELEKMFDLRGVQGRNWPEAEKAVAFSIFPELRDLLTKIKIFARLSAD